MASMREALVKQATNFLNNPGLKSQTLDKKREFLKGKGLTDEEIEEARKRTEEVAVSQAQTDTMLGSIAGSAIPGAQAGTGISTATGNAAAANGTRASMVPRGSTLQAALLLRRRLAELEHERACYIEALEALGIEGLGSTAVTLPVAQRQVPLAPTDSGAAGASTTATQFTGVEPAGGGAAPGNAGSSSVQSSKTAARKPWEATGAPLKTIDGTTLIPSDPPASDTNTGEAVDGNWTLNNPTPPQSRSDETAGNWGADEVISK